MLAKSETNTKQTHHVSIAIIGDEQSMLQSSVLGAFERKVAKAAHGGGHTEEVFGGISIVILLGDDGQLVLPMGGGAFDALDSNRAAH